MPQVKAIYMKRIYCCLFLTILLFTQCSKDASSLNNMSAVTTGAGGSLARFAIAGNYLYTVDDQNLTTYDITNPENPVLKSTRNVGFEIETISPFKDKLFIGSTSVVYIFSLADPASPQQLGVAVSPQVLRRCDPVVAKDTVAFATLRTNGPCGGFQSILAIYDIKDIQNPIQKGMVGVGEPYGLGYSGDALYVCDKQRGLMVFDINNAYTPQVVRTLRDGTYIDVIPYQDMLICWVSTGIIVYDISNNKNPIRIATIN